MNDIGNGGPGAMAATSPAAMMSSSATSMLSRLVQNGGWVSAMADPSMTSSLFSPNPPLRTLEDLQANPAVKSMLPANAATQPLAGMPYTTNGISSNGAASGAFGQMLRQQMQGQVSGATPTAFTGSPATGNREKTVAEFSFLIICCVLDINSQDPETLPCDLCCLPGSLVRHLAL